MNKTMAIIAVVIGLLTAFIIAETGNDSNGFEVSSGTNAFIRIDGIDYWSVPDADFRCYSDSNLICENIYIKEGQIRDCAFRNCKTLERVYCSVLTTSIGDRAFEGCTALKSVYMVGIKTIGEEAFMNSSVSNITTGLSLKSIGNYAFAYCRNLADPILADTNIKTLGTGVFYNSKILTEDIRNITEIDETAFKDADIYCIAMRTDQVIFNDTPIRLYDDDDLFSEISYHSDNGSKGVKMRVGMYTVLDPHDSDGNPITAAYSTTTRNSNPVTFSTIILSEGQDCYLKVASTTVHFQDHIGLEDLVILTGSPKYTLPDGPKLEDLVFEGWSIPGVDDNISSLSPKMIAEMWPLIEPVAHYSSSIVTFDHSQLSAPLASALPTNMTFTLGSVYPTLNNIGTMGFACWVVNGEVFEGGEPITVFSGHTAKSVWAENGMFSLTVHDCSAQIYSIMDVVCTSSTDLSDIAFEEPNDRILLGWSLTDGGDRIKTETIRLISDADVYPVTKNRAKYTITYMDGFDTIGTQIFNEGRPSAIDIELPEKEGKRFTRWMCEGTEYNMGDILRIDRDMTLYSEWVTLPSFTVSYETNPRADYRLSEGSIINIGVDVQRPDHVYLGGWTETDTNDFVYADGQQYVVTKDVSFSPVWIECPRYTVTIHGFDGSVTDRSVYSDESFLLESPEPTYGFTFIGWGTTAGSPPEYRSADVLQLDKNIELFEIWIKNGMFSVIVHDGLTEPMTAYDGESITVTLSPILSEGFVLLGWSASENSESPEYDPSCTIVLHESTDIYPVWERLMALRYHNEDDTQSEYHPKGSIVELRVLSDQEMLFAGWAEDSNGAPVDGLTVTMNGDVDLYAVWTEKESDETEPVTDPVTDGTQTRAGIGLVEGATAATVALLAGLMVYFIRRN